MYVCMYVCMYKDIDVDTSTETLLRTDISTDASRYTHVGSALERLGQVRDVVSPPLQQKPLDLRHGEGGCQGFG